MITDFKAKLHTVLADEKVQAIPELYQVCSQALERLEAGDRPDAVMAQLSQALSLYLMQHSYKAPDAIVDLGMWLAKAPHRYRGKISFFQMLAMSLQALR